MSEFSTRLAKLPETNAAAWNEINAIIHSTKVGLWQPTGKPVQVQFYDPGTDKWDFADINESKQRAINEILRKHPLGGDHFAEWLKTGEVRLPGFNHPSDPGFITAYLEAHWLCELTQVSHSLHYSECDHQWNWDIQSASKQEAFSGKSYSLSTACECVLEHLFKINKDYLIKERDLTAKGAVDKDEVVEKCSFVMGYTSGRVTLTAGTAHRTPRYVVGVKDISFSKRDGAWRDDRPTAFELVHVEADIDQLQYRLKYDGKDVGMMQFDYSHRTIEWEIEKRYIGTSVSFYAIVAKAKS